MNVGEKVDELYNLRDSRYKLNREVRTIQEKETALSKEIEEYLDSAGLRGCAGHNASVLRNAMTIADIVNVDDFKKFLIDSNGWHYAQTIKPSLTAIKDAWEDGVEIPGINKLEIDKLSITKI